MAITFTDLHTEAGLKSLDQHLSSKSYISGNQVTKDDIKVYGAVLEKPGDAFPNASKWYESLSSLLAPRCVCSLSLTFNWYMNCWSYGSVVDVFFLILFCLFIVFSFPGKAAGVRIGGSGAAPAEAAAPAPAAVR